MGRRRSITVAGVHHTNPIPAASVVGSILVSGGIFGRDPETGMLGADLPTQCRLVFENIETIMAAAGGTPDDIVKVTVWLADAADKTALNDAWCRMFPDEQSRPARHAHSNPTMPRGQFIQAEIMAVLA